MSDPSERYVIVFNGEIFNFLELRSELAASGLNFRSHSDTEVLLHLYLREGAAFLHKLNGFFALAIYDRQARSLFIARDRLGIKPLLYHHSQEGFLFASELKALLAFPIKRRLNHAALLQYLQCGYVSAPLSMLEGVYKLQPGHSITIKDHIVSVAQWYKIPYDEARAQNNPLSYEQQQQRLLELMDDAVRLRLISDVPVGAFLSGGIDSSAVVALASRHTKQLNTFSIGFEGANFFDETAFAELVAKRYNTRHTVFRLSESAMYDELFAMLECVDEPFADSSALLVYILSKHTRQHVTVSLSGDGGDELFAGYHKYAGELRARQPGLSGHVVRLLGPLWAALPKSRNSFIGNKIRQLDRYASGASMRHADRYWRWLGTADEYAALSLLKAQTGLPEGYSVLKNGLLAPLGEGHSLNQVLLADVLNVLPNDMLHKVDSMSMAHSLEVRVPFLDYRVLEFAFSLPVSSKINRQMKKRIVQDAFRDLLPAELYNRPKQGFELPLTQWMRNSLYPMLKADWLSDEFLHEQGLFAAAEVQRLMSRLFSRDPQDAHQRLWGLFVFQYWYKKYMQD